MHIVKRFHCDYCTKTLAKKNDMAEHEKHCHRNPESRSCATCANFTTVTERCGHTEVPVCKLAEFDLEKRSPRNPFGLRSECPYHSTDPYRY